MRERQRGRERRQQRGGSSGLDSVTGYTTAAGFHHLCPETLQFPSLPWGAYVSPLPGLGLGQGTDSGQWHGSTHRTPRGLRVPLPPPGEPAVGEAEGPHSAPETPAPHLRLREHTVRSAQLVQPRSDVRAKSLLAVTGHRHLCGC